MTKKSNILIVICTVLSTLVAIATLALDIFDSDIESKKASSEPHEMETNAVITPAHENTNNSENLNNDLVEISSDITFSEVEGCKSDVVSGTQTSSDTRVAVGSCWNPCEGIAVVVKEVFLDTSGKASNRVVIDWNGRDVKRVSYQVGAFLQLSKNCQIQIKGTGDTLNSQYVDLITSSNPDYIKLYK